MPERLTISWEFSHQVTDAAIDYYIGWLKDAQRQAEAGHGARRRLAQMALTALAEVVRGLGGWAAEELQLKRPYEEYFKLPVNERREQTAAALELGIPIMQPEARAEITDALRALNANQQTPIFEVVVDRRGDAPDLTATTQLRLLMWVRWEHGRGASVSDAEARVAEAAGCALSTLKDWRRALESVYGKSYVDLKLLLAEQVGRYEAQGKTMQDLRPRESDHDQLLWETWLLERDLAALVEILKEARGKRRIPK